MSFLLKARSLFKKINSNKKSDGEVVANAVKKKLLTTATLPFILPLVFVFLIIFVAFLTLFVDMGYDYDMMFSEDPNRVRSSGVNLDYDFEDYYNSSVSAFESSGSPSSDLATSEYKNVSNFNQHIKDSVNSAGFGTRQGVVAAGVALVGDYIKATGRRVKYDQDTRQSSEIEGIANPNYLTLDCSGFSWWALYNGGFNIPCYPYTGSIYSWASSNGYAKPGTSGGGQPGDFLVTYGKGHVILIIGTYEGGYYCAEELGWGSGAEITKHSIQNLGNYALVDMTSYYSNSVNVRSQ